MRKGISTISVFSMAITFVAAVVLCMQVAQAKQHLPWNPSELTVWGIEIGLFGLVVFAWRRTTALSGWAVGIAALLAVRLALTAACAYGLGGLRGGPAYAHGMALMSQFVPRLTAALFSLIVFYPMRALLPERLGVGRKPQAASRKPVTNGMVAGDTSVWMMTGEGQSRSARPQPEENAAPSIVTIATPDQYRGTVAVPLRVLLAHVPADCLNTKGVAQQGDSLPISVPLSLIVPQLREAQLVLSLEELRKLLPAGLLTKPEAIGLEGEPTLVFLAVEEVVPLLPSDVWELPPPSPPAWAELPDPEDVVFATT
jgi:hypothetical protein